MEVGPDRPTLCSGWTTRDLAAHIVVRERRPDSMVGVLVAPLAGHGEHVRLAKAAEPWAKIIDDLRTPPWWSILSNPVTDELVNAGELFIHHEDVRRGEPGWQARTLEPGQEQALWRAAKLTGRLALRKLGVPVTVRALGLGELTVGERPEVTVTGRAGELTLFLSGRQRAADVDISGPAEGAERLRTASLGI